jgi:hypothetical protein
VATPFWLADSKMKFDELPKSVQAAITEIVEPAYREFVIEAPSTMERVAGLSVVFQLNLEVIDQLELGTQMTFSSDSDDAAREAWEKTLVRHLRLIGAKQKSLGFLQRLRHERFARGPLGWEDNEGRS